MGDKDPLIKGHPHSYDGKTPSGLREENKLLKAVSENQVVQITELSEKLSKPKSMAYIIWED